MKSVPVHEAEELLANPLRCEDIEDWWHDRNQPGLARAECGLIAQDGTRSGLMVQLFFSDSPKTRLVEFKFTVFKMRLAARQRVYQLHVNAVSRAPKNWHDFAHEHMGEARINGSADWLSWGFSEALDYFCKRTNITFLPPVRDPGLFELT